MRETLPIALRLMFGDEGGYANRSTDAGGPTKYGITARTLGAHRGGGVASAAEVKALTLAEAEDIYRQSYWSQSGGDVLPVGLDYAAFDFGVNSGPNRAVKVLQKVVGVKQDGWIGPQTLAAVAGYPGGVADLISDYCDGRMDFLRSLTSKKTGFPVNGRGWTIRVIGVDPKGQYPVQPGVEGNAIALAVGVLPTAKVVSDDTSPKAEPTDKSPWTDPSVILPGAGGLLGGVGTLFAGTGPVQWALALAVVAAVGVGIVFAVKHLRSNPR